MQASVDVASFSAVQCNVGAFICPGHLDHRMFPVQRLHRRRRCFGTGRIL